MCIETGPRKPRKVGISLWCQIIFILLEINIKRWGPDIGFRTVSLAWTQVPDSYSPTAISRPLGFITHRLCTPFAPVVDPQLEGASASLRDQQRMTDRYREECEAVLAGREGTALGLAVELQQARSGMAAKETECNVLKVWVANGLYQRSGSFRCSIQGHSDFF